MNKCLCCNKDLKDDGLIWHQSCIKKFFGTNTIPTVDISKYKTAFSSRSEKSPVVTGVQKKFPLHLEKNSNNPRLTLIDFPSGYILKINNREYPEMCENEYLTMHLAKICGIETIPFGLIKLEDKSLAYITKRIDRAKNHKIAMEDFCQLGNVLTEQKYKSSYEQVGKILSQYSQNIGLDYYKLYNIILFSFITGNSDMHLKNFSIYKNKGKYVLTPAYDLINTLIITDDNEELALSIDGKKRKLKKENFINLAKRYNLLDVQIDRIFNNFNSKHQLIINTINESLLNNDLKDKYIDIINNRCQRLFG
ncbi:MAG: HipA domain-containing protein [Sphaerochaetaceae bacterium]|nr:HipA domain-containing protein [Sphaerochaetaceae bacterium]MDC7248630.1 HipA domain-containing protein [Sphaerochaetaceae bacterium]